MALLVEVVVVISTVNQKRITVGTAERLRERLGEGTAGVFGGSCTLRPENRKPAVTSYGVCCVYQ